MAILETGLYAHLTSDVGVAALVGSRVYPVWFDQSTTIPAITFQRVSTQPTHGLNGDHQLTTARFQIVSFAPTMLAAAQLAEAVRTAIDADVGTWGDVTVSACFRVDSQLDPAVEIDAWRFTDDYMITYIDN